MIERTDEMERVMYAALAEQEPGRHHAALRKGLDAVLAIVEREVVPEAYGMGRDDEASDAPMAVTLDEINARRGRPWWTETA